MSFYVVVDVVVVVSLRQRKAPLLILTRIINIIRGRPQET
jgi:hypothetical protein